MFGRRKAKKAAKEYERALEHWKEQVAWYAEMLRTTAEFNGTGSSELVLHPDEAVFFKVAGAGLIEERRERGRNEGRSSGVSVPAASVDGRAVRYRAGANRGHYAQAAPEPMAVDTGNVYITNERVIFQGRQQTRECTFAKLIGFHHDARKGETTFSVSNRQKTTTLHYGPELAGDFRFRLDLALAHYRGTVGELSEQLLREAKTIEAERPAQPAPNA